MIRFIFKLILLIILLVGLNHFGVFKYFTQKNVDNAKQIERSSSIINLSNINDEFRINYVFKFLQYSLISISHIGANQKFYIIKCPKNRLFKEIDFKNGVLEKKVTEFNKNTQTCFIHLENFKFIKKDILSGKNIKFPYALFQSEVINMPAYGKIRGIIGASDSFQDANLVFVAYNDNQKYSTILTNEFFKSIETKTGKVTDKTKK